MLRSFIIGLYFRSLTCEKQSNIQTKDKHFFHTQAGAHTLGETRKLYHTQTKRILNLMKFTIVRHVLFNNEEMPRSLSSFA